MSRRKFLQGLAAASAGVLVADARIIAAPSTACTDIWPAFKKQNKDRYPCVLVMEFSLLHHRQFLALAESKSRHLRTLLSHVPIILMDKNQLKAHFKISDSNSNIFLISLDSKVLKKGSLRYSVLGDSRKLAAGLDEFYFSDRVLQNAWKKFAPEKNEGLEKLLKTIDEGNFRERKKARLEIGREMKKNLWQVALCARTSKSIEQRESCRDLLIQYKGKIPLVSGAPAADAGQVRTVIACGMASMPAASRKFVSGFTYA